MTTDAAEREPGAGGHALARRWFAGVLARRGVVVSLAVAWAVAGAALFVTLPRDLFPNLALPTVQLLVQSPGRGAAELELAVAQPVEQALAGLPGVRRTTSTVQSGVVQVIVAFESGSDPWRSRQLVAERLALVAGDFPDGTGAPLMTSAAGRLQEIQELVLEGPAIDPLRLRDQAVQVLVPRLQSILGVARVEMLGGEARQVQVSLSPERMRGAGVSLAQVIEALEGSDQDVSAGVLEVRDKQWNVAVASRARTPAGLARLPVHTAHGLVALGDVAEIREGPEFRMGLARYQGFEAVSMRVVKQPDAETLATARRVRAALPELQRALPEGMTLGLFYDQGQLVEHALGGVGDALLVGALFVAAVLVALLGSVRGATVVLVLLPLATLGAAVPLRALGLGLNAMTLGGLAIAVGLLVDAGVIMVENLVHRLREESHAGASRTARLAAAAAEVAVPIATAVLVILAVFVPLLAIGGVAGKLYAPLAVSVAAAMALSLVFSFTLVPVLVDRFLPPGSRLDEPRLVAALKRLYRPLLDFALRRGAVVQVVALAMALPAIWLGTRLGSDFLPELDEGAIMAQTVLPSDASLAAIDAANEQFEAAVAAVDGVASIYRRTGRGELTEDPMPTYLSDVLVVLAPGARAAAVEREIAEIGERMPFGVEITTPMNMRISEGIGGTPADIQVELYAADLAPVVARQAEIQARLAAVPGVESVTVDTGAPLPSWRIVPDDDALRRLDVPRGDLVATARAALQGIALAPTYDGVQRVERALRFPADGRTTMETLKRLPIVVEQGRIVELGQVAAIVEEPAPSMIRRKNGQRRLGFNVRTAGDLGGTARRIEAAIATMELPRGTTFALAGKVEEARETNRRLLAASAVALALVVGLLYLALGRWREVAVVLGTLPIAFAGGLVALHLARESWNASSIVGMIGLFGVAVQNSLVLITQTKELLARGAGFRAALREASIGRVRPKLMTAGAAILGLAPMLLGFGGSELERPLAVVMVGGLVTSTLFTLLVLPSVYASVGGSRDSAGAEAIDA
jgi:cobalt-zinc-cadmium resistance protein CzcA